jgi:G3E family GTPase
VAHAVERVEGAEIGTKVTVVDAGKCRMYARNFGEFFNDQVASADLIVLSRTDTANDAKTMAAVELLKGINPEARLITTPWDQLSGAQIREVMEENVLQRELREMEQEHHHHHDHDDDDEHECCCHHHDHDDDDDEHECCCHHHDHDDEDNEHECCHHHLDHDGDECDDPDCECHHHHDDDDDDDGHEHHHHDDDDDAHEHHHHGHDEHEHHHHDHHGHEHHHHGADGHDADEVFGNIGLETARRYEQDEIRAMLEKLSDEEEYGRVLRAKGILQNAAGEWFQFDYVPGEIDMRSGSADYTGRLCVIGCKINQPAIRELFGI